MSEIGNEVEGVLAESTFSGSADSSKKEPAKGVKSLAKLWDERLQSAKLTMGDFEAEIKKDREYINGSQEDDDSGKLVRANLIHSHIRRSVNQVYARNPQFSIRPIEQINGENQKMMRLFGRTCEIVLNKHFSDADLKRRAKATVRAAKSTGVGWTKIHYQTELEPDPIIRNRIKDFRDDLEQLEYLKEQLTDEKMRSEKERMILEKKQFLVQLEKEEMRVASEGLVIDVVDTKNIILDLSTIRNFDEYSLSPFIAEAIWMTRADVKKRFDKEIPAGTKTFSVKGHKPEDGHRNGESSAEVVKVYEIWDRVNKLVHYLPEGADEFLSEPLTPKIVSEHWYPYIPLGLNIIDGQFWPLSDVRLLRELQDEHNSARTRFASHRDIAIPHWIGKKDEVTPQDAKTVEGAVTGEVALIDGIPGQPVKASIDVFSPPPIDPAQYSTDHTERDFERVTGGGDVTQPKNNRSRTLGEAELLTQDTNSQISADNDEVEDWFERSAIHTLQILLQVLTEEQVVEISGAMSEPMIDEQTGQPTGEIKEGSVWPQMDKTQIFNMLELSIQAGSSGKPNKDKEVQVWTQFLMPKITDLIAQVAELRKAGQNDLAESLIFVGQETLRRMDERFDIKEFLPKQKQGEPDPAQVEQQQKEAENAEIQKEGVVAEIENVKSDTAKNLAQAAKAEADAKGNTFDQSLKAFKAQSDIAAKGQQLHNEGQRMENEQDINTANLVRQTIADKSKAEADVRKTNQSQGVNNGQ